MKRRTRRESHAPRDAKPPRSGEGEAQPDDSAVETSPLPVTPPERLSFTELTERAAHRSEVLFASIFQMEPSISHVATAFSPRYGTRGIELPTAFFDARAGMVAGGTPNYLVIVVAVSATHVLLVACPARQGVERALRAAESAAFEYRRSFLATDSTPSANAARQQLVQAFKQIAGPAVRSMVEKARTAPPPASVPIPSRTYNNRFVRQALRLPGARVAGVHRSEPSELLSFAVAPTQDPGEISRDAVFTRTRGDTWVGYTPYHFVVIAHLTPASNLYLFFRRRVDVNRTLRAVAQAAFAYRRKVSPYVQ